jgi:hypothetical protein
MLRLVIFSIDEWVEVAQRVLRFAPRVGNASLRGGLICVLASNSTRHQEGKSFGIREVDGILPKGGC